MLCPACLYARATIGFHPAGRTAIVPAGKTAKPMRHLLFSLDGRLLQNGPAKGIFIKDGKKVLRK